MIINIIYPHNVIISNLKERGRSIYTNAGNFQDILKDVKVIQYTVCTNLLKQKNMYLHIHEYAFKITE